VYTYWRQSCFSTKFTQPPCLHSWRQGESSIGMSAVDHMSLRRHTDSKRRPSATESDAKRNVVRHRPYTMQDDVALLPERRHGNVHLPGKSALRLVPQESRNRPTRVRVQTVCGAHPASCPMGTGCPYPGGKARQGRDADHSPHLVPRSRMSRSYTSSLP
jgi:hypothetical protein